MSVTLIPDDLRTAVIELHGSRCLCCGVQCTWSGPTRLHIDHVIPEARGGRTVLDNLQVLCRTCNLRKGATTADYRKVRPKPQIPWFDRARNCVAGHHATRNNRVFDKRVNCECGWSSNSARREPAVDEYSHHLDDYATLADVMRGVQAGAIT